MFIVLVLTVLISNSFVYNLTLQQASDIKHMTPLQMKMVYDLLMIEMKMSDAVF